MKRLLSKLLVVVLSVSLFLTACTTNKEVPKKSEEPKKEVSAEVKGEITVWIWESAKKAIEVNNEAFKKAYPNLTVKYEVIPSEDLYKKFMLAVQAGEGAPDVFAVASRNLPQMISTKGLLDITSRFGDDIKKINKHKIQMATGSDGKIYGVPWDSGPVAMYYNRKVFKDAGFPDSPEEVSKLLDTWDNYYKVAKQIKEKTGSYIFSEAKTNVNPDYFCMMLNQKAEKENVWLFDKDGNVKIDSPQAVRIAQFLTKLYAEGLVYDAVWRSAPWMEAYKTDKVATYFNGAWMTPTLKQAYGDKQGNWGVIPLPVWDQGDARTAENGGSNLVITKQAKNVEGAWAYIKYNLMNDASQKAQYKYGFFPSWEPAYGDPEVVKADPFFAGQVERKVFEEAAKNIPAVNSTPDLARARTAVASALELCFNDKSKTVEQNLKAAADEVRSKTGRK